MLSRHQPDFITRGPKLGIRIFDIPKIRCYPGNIGLKNLTPRHLSFLLEKMNHQALSLGPTPPFLPYGALARFSKAD
jgi:hypothetical protein